MPNVRVIGSHCDDGSSGESMTKRTITIDRALLEQALEAMQSYAAIERKVRGEKE